MFGEAALPEPPRSGAVRARPVLEVIALDAEDARAAREGGADRLELVTDMAADGLTPSRETFARVRAAVDLPLRVMLRGGAGFTAGGDAALDALCAQARRLRSEGADEFVLGFLDEAGGPDLRAITAVTDVIDGCPWTFHRAIDRAADREGLRKALADFADSTGSGDFADSTGLADAGEAGRADRAGRRASAVGPGRGPDGYLTAGSPHGVDAGMDVLCAEAARAAAAEPGYVPGNIAGGGLRLEHVASLAAAGVGAFHIGGTARRGGWSGPVDARLVGEWRAALDS
ncbi:copper homeostasis protein CutC [Streptomyces abyssalis]|uniref:Copper homeostasis protein cutC homolog n=1 Tax=Streptomyces abyssalis TaxID=933944 RepID=A0A1E7JQV0_9ACTN|nr:copper homeostasis protein CutC [Streptomyces abyssalis]OEU90661.1 copper homeostasis protein CutC [Streptomyces abyssalis]